MKNMRLAGAMLLFGILISLTVASGRTAAQGAAGAGASAAAQGGSNSFNPISWMKRDSKSVTDGPELRLSAEERLTPAMHAEGLLAADVSLTEACAPFVALDGCLAAVHASHNLGLGFNCLRAGVTGVLTNADMSGCKTAGAEKAQDLDRAIHQLKPEANAGHASKVAVQQAKDDLKTIGL